MTQAAKSQEPSMEEILASIRRIIADDDANKSVQNAAAVRVEPPAPEPEPEPEFAAPDVVPPTAFEDEPEPATLDADVEEQASDILDLTESMATPAPVEAPAAQVAPTPTVQFRTIDGSPDVGFEEAPVRPAASGHAGRENGHLLSSETSSAVNSAFNALAQTVLVQNARTLEDLVREMLRPMLKTWLDDNLPSMVERLVRAEIERVSRGRSD